MVVGLTILSGYLQGNMSRRWEVPADMLAIGKALERFPSQVGPWQVVSNEALSETVTQVLECTGYVLRNYTNPETGETVSLGLLLGPSGPMAIHTPDICYSSQAYDRVDEPKQVKIAGKNGLEGEFWAQTFKAKSVDGELLRVRYAWRADGIWHATEGARLALARYPYLYKVQVAAPLSDLADDNDAGYRFLQDFLAVAQTELK